MNTKRLKKLKLILQRESQPLFPYLITDPKNIFYLSGFKGSYAYLLVDQKKSYLISDARYQEYAESILPPEIKFILQKDNFYKTLNSILEKIKREFLYIEDASLTLKTFLQIKKNIKKIKIIPTPSKISHLRIIKNDQEIKILKKAAQITDQCISHLLKIIKPGLYEWDLVIEIEHFFKTHKCRQTSFEPIVASGPNSSKPHHQSSNRQKIKTNAPLLIDLGCEYQGYNSDLTRTFFINKVNSRLKTIYNIVLEAQLEAISFVKPGLKTIALDNIARKIISQKGYGDYFTHSLGHGFGLEIHEDPLINNRHNIELKPKMTITIEPGIYLPGYGGVRIEDMVLVTDTGYEVLTKSTKDLTII